MSLPELSALFPRESGIERTRRTERSRGRRIAGELGVRIILVDGLEFVARADVAKAVQP